MRFKVGDEVVARQWVGKDSNATGVHGYIVAINRRAGAPYLVQFSENVNGHDGNYKKYKGLCKYGYGWWCRKDGIKKEKQDMISNIKNEFKNDPIKTIGSLITSLGVLGGVAMVALKEWEKRKAETPNEET